MNPARGAARRPGGRACPRCEPPPSPGRRGLPRVLQGRRGAGGLKGEAASPFPQSASFPPPAPRFTAASPRATAALCGPRISLMTVIGGGWGAAGHSRCECACVAGPGATRRAVLPRPARATAVSSTRPACHTGDEVGLISLIDTFLPHSTLWRLSLIPPFIFLRGGSCSAPPPRNGEGKSHVRNNGTRVVLQKYTGFNKGTG